MAEGQASKVARLEEEASAATKIHQAYIDGLEKGIEMATGKFVKRTPASAGISD